MIYPILCQGNDLPLTLYSILESYVNYGKSASDTVKIKDMWTVGRNYLFDFHYPLSVETKEVFEHNIINHYLMRRINFETVNLFKIMLENKLNEIMPKYNILFSKLNGWDIFKADTTTREYKDSGITSNSTTQHNTASGSTTSNGSSKNSGDSAYSDTPQSQITDIADNSYISEYTKTSSSGTTDMTTTNNNTIDNTGVESGTSTKDISETVNRTVTNTLDVYLKFQEEYNNIYTMIYKDLDCLFYGLV